MINFEYEREAKANAPMPDGLSLPEQWCWQSIALLTGRYRYGLISGDAAAKELAFIKKQFNEMQAEVKYIKHCSELWRNVEGAAMRFNENPTIENAYEMRKAIYGDVFKNKGEAVNE